MLPLLESTVGFFTLLREYSQQNLALVRSLAPKVSFWMSVTMTEDPHIP